MPSDGGWPMSPLPPKADMCGATTDVRFGPKADIPIKHRIVVFAPVVASNNRLLLIDADGLATGPIAQTRSKAILLPCHIFRLVVPARIQASEREPNPRGSRAVTGVPR